MSERHVHDVVRRVELPRALVAENRGPSCPDLDEGTGR